MRDIRDLLIKIQRTYAHERTECISVLQDKIWDGPEVKDEELQTLLSDLAYDLNFYEPEERDRDESLGYYGYEKLDTLISAAIEKTESYLAKGN